MKLLLHKNESHSALIFCVLGQTFRWIERRQPVDINSAIEIQCLKSQPIEYLCSILIMIVIIFCYASEQKVHLILGVISFIVRRRKI